MILGIDSRRYWLLVELLGRLSDRGEMLDQLGRDRVALKTAAWLYAVMSGFFSLVSMAVGSDAGSHLSSCMALTGFVLLFVLLSETGNSLVNPVEGVVLAHQPVDGATYTAAKLTHLVRIVLYLVAALNVPPALAGLALRNARWFYPLIHLLAAFAVGIVAALLCCALYGWLMRFIPARRLKAAGQIAATVPFLAMAWWPQAGKLLSRLRIPTGARWGLGVAVGIAVAAIIVFGIRSLSADYLIRVSGLMRGGPAAGAKSRRSRMGEIVARFFGGQPARAGFAFARSMMLRDWQFRRQIFPLLATTLMALAPLFAGRWRIDPLSGRLTLMHILPHLFGVVLFYICTFLPYGNDYKGAWILLLAPQGAFGAFARGVYALLWIGMVVIPHAFLLPVLAWFWGVWHAGLFVAYSAAVASVYLALELRLIEGAPFTKQADSSRGAVLLPMLMLGGLAVAIAVGLQYVFIFRSPLAVAIAAIVLAAAAYFLTRISLDAFAASIRYGLALAASESAGLYKEVDL